MSTLAPRFPAERYQCLGIHMIIGTVWPHTLPFGSMIWRRFTSVRVLVQQSTSTACSFPGRTTKKGPRHELLEHCSRSPTGSREGRVGSLSKRCPRRCSFEGLVQVCLSVGRRASALCPEAQREVQFDGRSSSLCWQLAEKCAVQHAG